MPRIPYRETITGNAETVYRHKKQSGGAGQFGEGRQLEHAADDLEPAALEHVARLVAR